MTLTGSLPAASHPFTAPFPVPSPTQFARDRSRRIARRCGNSDQAPEKSPLRLISKASLTSTRRTTRWPSTSLSRSPKKSKSHSRSARIFTPAWGLISSALSSPRTPVDPVHSGFKIEHAFLAGRQARSLWRFARRRRRRRLGGSLQPRFRRPLHGLLEYAPRLPRLLQSAAYSRQGWHARQDSSQQSPAAGHVFAKTGTFGSEDKLNGKMMLRGKGLAGYVITKSGEKLAFAAYVNNVSLPPDPDAAQEVAGQALGEIAAAAYDAPLNTSSPSASAGPAAR